MTNRQTSVKATHRDGELTLQQHETDAPILPVSALERLQKFKPEAVDLVLEQTKAEAQHRRGQEARIARFVFIETIVGQCLSALIGLAGITAGGYIALHGQPAAGGTIATAAITGLAIAFLRRQRG